MSRGTRKYRFPTSRFLINLSTIACAAIAVGVVVISPWLLDFLDTPGHINWIRLGNIGQTYGAISAIIATMALFGVAISLVLQGREAKASRENNLRVLHMDLIKMALDEPLYLDCWTQGATSDLDSTRQDGYTNLMVSLWYSQYQIDALGEGALRGLSKSLFSTVPGRRFWKQAREIRRTSYKDRRSKKFHLILDQEYQKMVLASPPPGESIEAQVWGNFCDKIDVIKLSTLLLAFFVAFLSLRKFFKRRRMLR